MERTVSNESPGSLVGYQVLIVNDSGEIEDVHPDMVASFCIASLKQVEVMVGMVGQTKSQKLQVCEIYDGEIENPTFLFRSKSKVDVSNFRIGEIVMCGGKEDKIVGFIAPSDKQNYFDGYRYILDENGTMGPGTFHRLSK